MHCHQVHTFLTAMVIVTARLIGRPVFLTDLGGGHPYAPGNCLPLLRQATAFLLLSEYSRELWAAQPARSRPDRLEVIFGGVDTDRFRLAEGETSGGARRSEVLYVGRLLPHKGIEHLIDAIDPPVALRVVGRPYDRDYHTMLEERARGKPVAFETDIDDGGW